MQGGGGGLPIPKGLLAQFGIVAKELVHLLAELRLKGVQLGHDDVQPGIGQEVPQTVEEGECVLHGLTDQSSLVNPLGPPWYFWGLKQLRQHVLGMSSGPGVCYDSYFCDELKCHKAYQYADHELIQIEWPDNRDSYRWVKPSAQLSCELSYVPGRVQWHFGPYTDGIYKLVTYDKLNHILGSSMQLAPQNIISLQLQAVLDFILEYDSPEGWKTFSPVLELNPNVHDISKAHVQWTRNEIK